MERYVEAWSQPAAAGAMINYYRAAVRQSPKAAKAHLHRISAPTLVIWGQRDRYLGPDLWSAPWPVGCLPSRRRETDGPSGSVSSASVSLEVDLVTAYWAAAEKRDWEVFGALVAEDVVYDAPQSRERVRGRTAYVRFNREGFPGEWNIRVVKIVGSDRAAASWVSLTDADGTTQSGLSFFEMDANNRIASITDFWPEPYAVPPSRVHLVERY